MIGAVFFQVKKNGQKGERVKNAIKEETTRLKI